MANIPGTNQHSNISSNWMGSPAGFPRTMQGTPHAHHVTTTWHADPVAYRFVVDTRPLDGIDTVKEHIQNHGITLARIAASYSALNTSCLSY
eukprot:10219037-Lingulodinium_polyedra.AAC.1